MPSGSVIRWNSKPTCVALTSIPPRFGSLAARIGHILAQGAERLCVTIPWSYRRFPEWDGSLPDLPDGVTLNRAEDRGPATKALGAAALFPDSALLICDDDCHYGPGWLDAFQAASAAHPGCAIAGSSFHTGRLGLAPAGTIVQGFAGVLLDPGWLCPLPVAHPGEWVDDIWISASLAAHQIPVVRCPEARAAVHPEEAAGSLQDISIEGQSRAGLNRLAATAFADRFGIWRARRPSPF